MMQPSTQIRASLLVPLLLIACQQESTTPSSALVAAGGLSAAVTDNKVSTVKVIPDSQMVFVGDQFQVVAQAKNKAGQVLDRVPTWSVGNTAIFAVVSPPSATMTFKALKAGNTTAKATVDGLSRFSKAVVRAATGAKVDVTPSEATVASGATVQFTAKGLTKAGESAGVNVTWTSATGAVSPTGLVTAGSTPGVYRVIAVSRFGAADTSLVTVTAGAAQTASVTLVPASISLAAGDTARFAAFGRTTAGDSVGVDVTYTATGGAMNGPLYTAGGIAGSYRVIAMTAAGLGDTSDVTIAAAPVDHLTLLPDIAASRPGESTRFVTTVYNTVGDSVPEQVAYDATCGTVSGTGVFIAPQSGDRCLVIASSADKADTTEVAILTNQPGVGIPFGVYDLWSSNTVTRTSGVSAYTSGHDDILPGKIVSHIAAARARGLHIVLAMTGGSHSQYKTAGVFDLARWQAAMDAYNTQAIRDAVADGVADGTIVGNSVMDEPQQHGVSSDPEKTWGPAGTMTKARVDGMCAYVKSIFPTLPVGVGHDYQVFEPQNSYQVCDFLMSQYAARKGNIVAYRDGALAQAARDGMSVIFSMNLLEGGIQDKSGPWDCAGTGGKGDQSPNCAMTAQQIRDWGKVIGQAGCAMLTWKYDAAFMARPDNQAAFSDIAITLAGLPRTSCAGTRG